MSTVIAGLLFFVCIAVLTGVMALARTGGGSPLAVGLIGGALIIAAGTLLVVRRKLAR